MTHPKKYVIRHGTPQPPRLPRVAHMNLSLGEPRDPDFFAREHLFLQQVFYALRRNDQVGKIKVGKIKVGNMMLILRASHTGSDGTTHGDGG
ncbi:hypothetical protein MGG_16850 [Pyricularia oryzae 70-15]|uniref:Uncharacterized protein n=3 Tax=Pyricularia oryzae TaxID=318829 RepID=G4N430_PYRO7|nr:uncharacterized protein MGG_16850 [Pyricularia oryzae 70-15]ELQ43093.1 hypothetical protein OOU_Y34scaffold00174g58 [Pyricularia oryzae Y34]KAI7925061.1 hypothetical protein M9X92_003436 [Pyricularia oryzae]EHA52750.1 hypothetical protein MGG_16850 [Pyricularia oryzae 70-15]KAI7929053.1 hypothetical protein M0657_002489 [Pyricularia oryzae]QBZ59373.1 hypothetical protein PoMZ_04334 [Pyricularia oryzae]